MILSLGRSVRSLWSPVVMIVGLGFSMLGMVMVTMPAEPGVTRPTYFSSIAIGVVCALLGLPFVWGGARVGVFRTGDGLKVRQLFGTATTYRADEIQGFTLGQEEHHSVPLMLIYPSIKLTNGSEVDITSLASYRLIPGARRQALNAICKMGQWTNRPVLSTEA